MNLHDLVRRSAEEWGGRPAVRCGGEELTYAELDAAADAMAADLAALGAGPGERVLVWAAKGIRAVVASQAVLRTGAVHVPAGSTMPPEHVARIAEDCRPRVVCAAPADLARLDGALRAGTRFLDLDAPSRARGPAPASTGPPDGAAYVLYTSGSTGRPKGVAVSHAGALAFVEWAYRELGAGPRDRFANHAALTFDLSVLDLYAAFRAGACVVLVPEGYAFTPELLVDLVHRERISVWYSVPSALVLMLRDGGLAERPPPPSLRAVLFAGEVMPVEYVRMLAEWSPARLLNLYGPTETNACTFHEVVPADLERDRAVPIGRATSGNRVWARTADGRRAGAGEDGELMVEGPTVMLGYWGGEPVRGPYATGDLVQVREDGAFDFAGRLDHMAKVRGYRVEPGAVEAALEASPDVEEAAAVVTGSGVAAVVTAFVVLRRGARLGVLGLKRHASRHLPSYMIPEAVRFVPGLPLTPNGKTDRAALAREAGAAQDRKETT
ncbi:amino acid adenylation domain-containing protein [Nocardiopsis tropica]|uniref:Amino acid adenylation domain-containing protein n=1 Tax=Nocardiopsis tropica TaxID=109330 RepID=A0ABU7KU28_9ACTN|nr:amino acid adenylation domain-containing protein [Nocardiopsis umidischolae]MEE2052815.1 amino acid adenylation domain-containing protein [Nocardiopsis umidischolae]